MRFAVQYPHEQTSEVFPPGYGSRRAPRRAHTPDRQHSSGHRRAGIGGLQLAAPGRPERATAHVGEYPAA